MISTAPTVQLKSTAPTTVQKTLGRRFIVAGWISGRLSGSSSYEEGPWGIVAECAVVEDARLTLKLVRG